MRGSTVIRLLVRRRMTSVPLKKKQKNAKNKMTRYIIYTCRYIYSILVTEQESQADVHPSVTVQGTAELHPEGRPRAFLRGRAPHDVEIPEVAPAGGGDVPEDVGPEHRHRGSVAQLNPVCLRLSLIHI